MLPPLSPRRVASRRQLSRTSAMTARTSSRSTPIRLAISDASSSACCATSATAPTPARLSVSTGSPLASGHGREAATRAAGAVALASTKSDRPSAQPGPAPGASSREHHRARPHPLAVALRRGGDLLGLGGERAADRGDPGERAEVVAATCELGLALLERGDERRGEEDRRVGTRPDADEQREREVLERVAAEEVQRRDRAAA